MNPDFSDDLDLVQLERELQSLTPVAPRRELVQAIKARMEPVPRREVPRRERVVTFPWRRMVAPAAAAAAAVAVFNIDDSRREGDKPASIAGNDAAPIKWEPMPVLAEFREYLNKGYFINPYSEELELVDPRLAPLYVGPVYNFPYGNENNSVGGGTMRASFQQRKNRFIVPAGYGDGTSLRWE